MAIQTVGYFAQVPNRQYVPATQAPTYRPATTAGYTVDAYRPNPLPRFLQATQPQPGYPAPGYPQPGYGPTPAGYPSGTYPQQPAYPAPQPGYPQPGYPQPGVPQGTYPQPYPQPTYPTPGYPQPGYPGVGPTPPVGNPQMQNEIQRMLGTVMGIAAQIDAIVQGVKNPGAYPATIPGAYPGAYPGALPPLPAPPIAAPPPPPPPPPPPAPPIAAPALPAPPPVWNPQAPTLPGSTPAIVPAPAAQPAAGVFNFPGVRQGGRLAVAPGTTVKGYSIDGQAVVNQIDGKVLDLTLDASAAMGFVKVRANVRAEQQPDGTVRVKATEIDKNGAVKKVAFDDVATVVSSRPGELVLSAKGQTVTIRSGANGLVQISHPEANLNLTAYA